METSLQIAIAFQIQAEWFCFLDSSLSALQNCWLIEKTCHNSTDLLQPMACFSNTRPLKGDHCLG